MTTVAIEHVEIETVAGHDVVITGITLTSSDCFAGHAKGSPVDAIGIRWDRSGYARDTHPDYNIDMRSDTMQDLIDAADRLGAKS